MNLPALTANAQRTPEFLSRVGVRGKLFVAFYGISTLAVLGAGAALYSFTAIQDALETITQRQIPIAVKSQELSRRAERVVAAAPRLLTVANSAEKDAWSRTIAEDVSAVTALLAELRDVPGTAVHVLEKDVQQLRSNLTELDRLVNDRLALADTKRELLSQSIQLASELQGLLTPWVSVMDERIAQWRRLAADPTVSEELRDAKDREFEESLAWFRAVQESEVIASSISDQLQRAASADDPTAASVSGFRLVQSLNRLERLSASLDPKLRSLLLQTLTSLRAYVAGDNSIPALRQRELSAIEAAAKLLAENAERSERLTLTVDRVVTNATRGTTEANARALSVVRFSTWAVVAAVVTSLLSSALIVWLYVDRQLISRLRELSQSMLAIAGGNLHAPLPRRGGRDEIARMLDALAVFRDTAREVEELNLRERQVVLDTINYGVLILGPELRVRMYNRAFRELAELEEDFLQAKPSIKEVIESSQRRGLLGVPDEVRDEYVTTRLAEVRAADQPPREWHWPDGRVLQYDVVPLPDGGRMLTYFDLTQLKRTEEELRAAKEEAERASRTKSAFLASMSHELRTPLNAIIGFTRLVMRRSKDVLPPKQYDNLEKILASGEHLLGLINSILDLSKIEAGRMEVRLSEFVLGPLIDLSLRTTEPLVRGERVRLVKQGDVADLVLFSDQDKLKQILLNLLSNAAKFTEEGEITVSTAVEDGEVRISVADTGPGIPAPDLNVIFEEFRQLDSGSARAHKGTGLGLAISRQLASLLGGELAVESEVGVGSMFILSVPVRLSTEHGHSEPAPVMDLKSQTAPITKVNPEPAGGVVLAIEDDPNVIYLLTENLAEAGYRVVGAQSGEEGLRKAHELTPRAIILDIMMPDADGWQVLHALKSDDRTRNVPVIVLSVVDQKALGFRLGASDFLLKPFDREALVAALARVAPQCGRVLVVDDDPNIPELVRQWLDHTDCQIDWAADGSVALARLAEHRPTVILLDLLMPRMDGLSFLEALNADSEHRGIPVIVLTSKLLDESERAALQERVHGLIDKRGVDRASLMREVRRALPAAA